MKIAGHTIDEKSFNKPTPTQINTYVLAVCFVCTFLRTHMLKHIVFNENIRYEIDWWLGIINEFSLGIRPFFGVDVNTAYVKTDKVSSMDEPDAKKNVGKMVIWLLLLAGYWYLF
jgi:hypothetical protein